MTRSSRRGAARTSHRLSGPIRFRGSSSATRCCSPRRRALSAARSYHGGAVMVVQLLGAATLAGVGTSLMGLARLLAAYPVGQIVDSRGRRAGVLLGLSVGLVGSITLGLAMYWASFGILIVGLLVFGLGVGAVQQLRLAAADMYPPSRRAEGLGYVLTGSLIGPLGGPLLISAAQSVAKVNSVDPIAMAWFFVPVVIVPSIVLILFVRPDPKEIAANLGRFYPGYVAAPARAAEAGQVNFGAFVRASRNGLPSSPTSPPRAT